MMFVQISKGRRSAKEDTDASSKDETEDTNSPDETSPPLQSPEGFSTIELSSSQEDRTEHHRQLPQREQFFDRLKRSSVGKLFKGDNSSKEQDISIYTIGKGQTTKDTYDSNYFTTKFRHNAQRTNEQLNQDRNRTVASQANDYPPYRLCFLPPQDWRESDGKFQTVLKFLLCQCSLACFLLLWLISFAILFYLTEGSYEETLDDELSAMENSTMVSMATDLRLLDPEIDPWDDVLLKYTVKHREEIILLTRRGYKNDTTIWTFAGSLLCGVSILTTLGLAAPLPQTMTGVIGGVLFAIFGIPINLMLMVNLGRTIAIKIQLFSKEAENKVSNLRQRIINMRRFGEDRKQEMWPEQMFITEFQPPAWLSYVPLLSSIIYYIIGVLLFGLARGLPASETFVFFMDFSKGNPSNGLSRMGYSWYLEGAGILFGLNVALLRDSPFLGFSQIFTFYGLTTNSID